MNPAELQTITLDDLVLDAGTQVRDSVSPDTAREYSEDIDEILAGAPLEVVIILGRLVLAEGFHRVHACRLVGRATAPAWVRKGTLEDALTITGERNSSHGLRFTLSDRKKLARKFLEHCPELSHREVSRRAYCDRSTVAKIAESLGTSRPNRISPTGERYTVDEPEFDDVDPSGAPLDDRELPSEPDEKRIGASDRLGSTPTIVDIGRDVMGGIDLDPASEPRFNQIVNAGRIYDADDDGLQQDWDAERVFCNPPYSGTNVERFVTKAMAEYASGAASQVFLVLNNKTETDWFDRLLDVAVACLVRGRIRFIDPDTLEPTPGSGWSGTVLFYLGPRRGRFAKLTRDIGRVLLPRDGATLTLIGEARGFCVQCSKPCSTGKWCADCKQIHRTDRAWRPTARQMAEEELAAGRDPSPSRIAIACGAPSWVPVAELLVDAEMLPRREWRERIREAGRE